MLDKTEDETKKIRAENWPNNSDKSHPNQRRGDAKGEIEI